MKKVIMSFFVLFAVLFVINSTHIYAQDVVLPTEQVVEPTKQWTIEFSEAVNEASITTDNIRVETAAGKEQLISLHVQANNEVIVKATNGYIPGESYILYVTKNVTTQNGNRPLVEAVQKTFRVAAVMYEEAGTYDNSDTIINGDVLITADGVTLTNTIVRGNVEVDEAVGEGDVVLQDVIISGDLYANGGGENTVTLQSVDVNGSLIVHKVNNKIRILLTGTSTVNVAILRSGLIMMDRSLSGGAIETLEIPESIGASMPIVIEGNINALNMKAAANVTINGHVNTLQKPSNVTIKGNVTTGEKEPATIFEAIASSFLGNNSNANYVTQKLNLLTSHPKFPNASISWTSNNAAVDAKTGNVTRGTDNTIVRLTATVGTQQQTFDVQIVPQGVEGIRQDGSDARFAAGYPKAYVKNGIIHVDIQTVEAMRVYMLVNAINGHLASTKEGVIGGYVGSANILAQPNSSPYLETEANTLVTLNTGVSVTSDSREKHIEFVLSKLNNEDKGRLVSIVFDEKTVSSFDTSAPSIVSAYVNSKQNKVYVYMNENITADALKATDFTLSAGTVTSAKLHNYERSGQIASSIELAVSGVKAGDTVYYKGTSIQDQSPNKNAMEAAQQTIESAQSYVSEVVVGTDGKTMKVKMIGGAQPNEARNKLKATDFSVTNASGTKIPTTYSTSFASGWTSYDLTFAEKLQTTNSSVVTVAMDKAGLIDYGYDAFTAPLKGTVTDNLVGIADKTPKSVTYNKQTGVFKLTFDENMKLDYSSFAGGMTVKYDKQEYVLRGFLLSVAKPNELRISLLQHKHDLHSKKLYDALQQASSIAIQYKKRYGNAAGQIQDIGSALLPDFAYENVTIEQ